MNKENRVPLISFSVKFCCLCLLIIFPIIVYATIEVLIFFSVGWPEVIYYELMKKTWIDSFPALKQDRLSNGLLIYPDTFLLVYLKGLFYYTGILTLPGVLYNLFRKQIFSENNAMLIRAISYLRSFGAVVPTLTATLKVFLFSACGRLIFPLNFKKASLRTIVLGLTCLLSRTLLYGGKESGTRSRNITS